MLPSTINVPKISAKPKKNKKDRDADNVAGIVEKQAAYVYRAAFKDEMNEGPKVLLTNIKAQLILVVTWDDGSTSWELKPTISSFLKTQSSGYLYDIACRCEDKFEAYVAHLKKPPRGTGLDEDEEEVDEDEEDGDADGRTMKNSDSLNSRSTRLKKNSGNT